mmetsp:Transcript_51213/g.62663  ORF Transcript_51213/g.62663 Transcript_51213/m.62663 type:complete len:169 (+) Transcript_51213:57-563(+)
MGRSRLEKAKTIIRGAMVEWERNINDSKSWTSQNKNSKWSSNYIRDALEEILGGTWMVLIIKQNDYNAERGYPSYVLYEHHYAYFKEKICTNHAIDSEISNYLKDEFDWALISDLSAFQNSAQSKLNAKFSGYYKVHVFERGGSTDKIGDITFWKKSDQDIKAYIYKY